ncbi:hypothetical protein B0H19DRAFT_914474, partial [Mycena capillaripes]
LILLTRSDQYRLNPAILDACIHIILHPAISKQYGNEAMYLPAKLGRFVLHNPGPMSGNWFSHINVDHGAQVRWKYRIMRAIQIHPDSKSYDVVVTDASGVTICVFNDLLVQRLSVQPP